MTAEQDSKQTFDPPFSERPVLGADVQLEPAIKAAPGRKYVEQERGITTDYVVSMYAGTALRRGVPSMPIATFYGPCAKQDAYLFAAGTELHETNRALAMLLEMLADHVEDATASALIVRNDPTYARAMAGAKIARMQARGVEVVEITGMVAIAGHQSPIMTQRMGIYEAMQWILSDRNTVTHVREAGPRDALAANELSA